MKSSQWPAQSSTAYETEELCTAEDNGAQCQSITRNLSIPFPELCKLPAHTHTHTSILAQQKLIPDFSLISFSLAARFFKNKDIIQLIYQFSEKSLELLHEHSYNPLPKEKSSLLDLFEKEVKIYPIRF